MDKSIKVICDYHLQDQSLLPKIIKKPDGKEELETYCNFFIQRICKDLNYDKFIGLLANDIHAYCQRADEWFRTDSDGAFEAINKNRLIVAAITDKPHGHVAIGYPSDILVFSGKWNAYTIHVANVGKRNGVFGANYVFESPPDLFILKENGLF